MKYPDDIDTPEKRTAYDRTLAAAHQRYIAAWRELGRACAAELRRINAQIRQLAGK